MSDGHVAMEPVSNEYKDLVNFTVSSQMPFLGRTSHIRPESPG